MRPTTTSGLSAIVLLAAALSIGTGCATSTDDGAEEQVDTTADELSAASSRGLSLDEARSIVRFVHTAAAADLEEAGLPVEAARALVNARMTRRLVTVRDVERVAVAAAPAIRLQNATSDALCARYKKLAEGAYMAALICGSGPCWPMSSWYSYWRQVYDALAASVCEE